MKAIVEMTVDVELEIPDDLIDKIFGPPIENQDEDGNPVSYDPNDREGRGWRNYLYNLDSIDKVLEHLTYNSAFNNLRLENLEGWLLKPEESDRVVIMHPDVQFDYIKITEDSPALDRYRETT